jgi:hypothetical protein
MSETHAVLSLLEQKLSLLRAVLTISQQSLLLVDLEGLTPLLERKDGLIREIQLIDEALALHARMPPQLEALREEQAELVQAVLENERTLEVRIEQEHSRLRQELRDLDQETRLKQYLERARHKGGTVDLKK